MLQIQVFLHLHFKVDKIYIISLFVLHSQSWDQKQELTFWSSVGNTELSSKAIDDVQLAICSHAFVQILKGL